MANPWDKYQRPPADAPGPWRKFAPAASNEPMISVGGRQIPLSEYRMMPDDERQALRDQIGQSGTHSQTQSSPLDPFVQGTTFGFGDELRGVTQGAIGAMQGADFGDTYRRTVDEARGALDQQRRVDPWGSLGAEVAGAIPTGMMAGGQAAGAGNRLWQRMLTGGLVGAGQGAVYGAGAGDEGERIQGAGMGGALGFGAGLAVPALASGAGAAYRNVTNRGASNVAARNAGVSPQAARYLSETLAADDALGPNGLARMQAAGGEAMLADAGPSARTTLDHAIQRSGGAGLVARDAIGGRVSRDAQALQGALDSALGQPQGTQTLRADIASGTRSARSSAYDAAYASPIDYASPQGRELESILKRVSQSDINAANELMRMEGHQSRQILAKIADDGSVTYQRLPDVRQIDYITRALNDRAQSNAGLGAMGGQTNQGRVYQNLSGELRDTTRTAVPEYDTALNTAADPIRRSQAVQFGADLLRNTMARDEAATRIAQMTGPERQAAMQGARSHIDELLSRVSRTVQDGDTEAREAIAGLKLLGSRSSREKLTALLGEDEATRLLDEVDRVSQSFDLRASVADNSKTFQRQAAEQKLQDMTGGGVFSTAMQGEPLNATKRIIQMLTGETAENTRAQQDQILTEVARVLTDTTGQEMTRMQILRLLAGQTGANNTIAEQIMRTGSRMGVPAAASAVAQR